VVLAAMLVALAIDVRRSAGQLRQDDLAFERSGSGDWGEVGGMPLGLGRRLIGVGDDLAFRRAVARFDATRPSVANPAGSLGVAKASRRAERALAPIAKGDRDRLRRAEAANLLGALAFEAGRTNPEAAVTLRARSVDQFQAAIRTDPNGTPAKFNLELTLELSGQGGSGAQQHGRGNQAATVGAVVSPPGQGY
jgi:hypothetical protein